MITLEKLAAIIARTAKATGRYCVVEPRYTSDEGFSYSTYIARDSEDPEDTTTHIRYNSLEDAYNRYAEFLGEPLAPTEETLESLTETLESLDSQITDVKIRMTQLSLKPKPTFDDEDAFDDLDDDLFPF